MKGNEESIRIIESIGKFFQDIVTGKRLTLAQWIRKYIDSHPDYNHDSLLSKKTMDDLLIELNEISKGTRKNQNFSPIFDSI